MSGAGAHLITMWETNMGGADFPRDHVTASAVGVSSAIHDHDVRDVLWVEQAPVLMATGDALRVEQAPNLIST